MVNDTLAEVSVKHRDQTKQSAKQKAEEGDPAKNKTWGRAMWALYNEAQKQK